MNSERDKFLTEEIGECWHEWEGHWSDYKSCKKCGSYNKGTNSRWTNNNFSTWDGFGKLWEWARKQNWFYKLIDYKCKKYTKSEFLAEDSIIDPNRFANTVYAYLKEKVND